ncbi:hypothetical protein C8Q78DRAFT_992907 [Trametes maxima]|nr:hypothetical protein C8Q78DRAFT_992907 [Trametes maxima]
MFPFYPPPLSLRALSEPTIYTFLVPRDDPNPTPLHFPAFLPTRGGIPLTTAAFVLCTPIAPGSIIEALLLGPPLPPLKIRPGCTRQPPSYQYFGMGFKGVVICLRKVDEQHAEMVVKNTQESRAGRPKYLAVLFVALPGISIKAETWRYISDAGADVQAIPGGPHGWLGLFKTPADHDLLFVRYPSSTSEEPALQLPYEEELIIHSVHGDIETVEPGEFTNDVELANLSFAMGYFFLSGIPQQTVPELPGGPLIIPQYPPGLGLSIRLPNQPIHIPTLPQPTGPESSLKGTLECTDIVEGGLKDGPSRTAAPGPDTQLERRGLKRPLPVEDDNTIEFLPAAGATNVPEYSEHQPSSPAPVPIPFRLGFELSGP